MLFLDAAGEGNREHRPRAREVEVRLAADGEAPVQEALSGCLPHADPHSVALDVARRRREERGECAAPRVDEENRSAVGQAHVRQGTRELARLAVVAEGVEARGSRLPTAPLGIRLAREGDDRGTIASVEMQRTDPSTDGDDPRATECV